MKFVVALNFMFFFIRMKKEKLLIYIIKILNHYFFPYCIKTECFFKTIVYFFNKDILLNSILFYSGKKKDLEFKKKKKTTYDNIYNSSKIVIYKLKFRVSIYD